MSAGCCADAGFFDFTFDRTEGTEHQVLREDFYYRTETLLDLARNARPARALHGGLGEAARTASRRSGSTTRAHEGSALAGHRGRPAAGSTPRPYLSVSACGSSASR